MVGILQMAKEYLKARANPNGVYIDFTMGHGRDTLFLSQLAPQGRVVAFDIQPQAVQSAKTLLLSNGVSNAELVCDSHEHLLDYIHEPIDGGMFNLGFLPGGDHQLTTRVESTIKALTDAMQLLKAGGMLTVSVYPGHPEGEKEGERLIETLSKMDKKLWDVFLYRLINVSESPFLLIIIKR